MKCPKRIKMDGYCKLRLPTNMVAQLMCKFPDWYRNKLQVIHHAMFLNFMNIDKDYQLTFSADTMEYIITQDNKYVLAVKEDEEKAE